MDSSPSAAEEVHQILGTGISFSSKPHDLDVNAAKELREIQKKGIDGLEVHPDDAFEMEPQNLRKGFFLSNALSCWKNLVIDVHTKQNVIWRPHGSVFGYGVGHHASGYECLKRTFVYHKGHHKTNWIMVVYSLIHKNSYIKAYDVELCHVFQSDNYDPEPPKLVSNVFDFDQTSLNSCVEELEYLMENPKAFQDFDDFNGRNSKCDSRLKANGSNGKRANIWEHFTGIEVRGPDGEVMLTLAICHGCNMAYKTGKWDPKRRKVTNNGTNTLKEHYRKCSDHHHISGNPQGAHH